MSEALAKAQFPPLLMRACVLGALGLAFVGAAILFFQGRPQWILLVDNEPDSMRIRIVTTESETPVYQVRVLGERLLSAPLRLPATDAEKIDVEGIKTLFIDRTMGPGRWTVQVGPTKLDFWPTSLYVNDEHFSPPAEVTIEKEQAR
jgi:hypothetical protein